MTAGKIDDWALHAYVDGEVADDQRAEIEAFLRADPNAAATVNEWQNQKRALRQAFSGVVGESVPPSLLSAVRSEGSWRARPYLAIAAALALLLFGGLAGWILGHDTSRAPLMSIAGRAIVAHEVYAAEVKHPVEVPASDKAHLQAWLSKRVGTAFVVPDLEAQGYTLLGGRLLAAEDRPAAQLMYEDAQRRRITVFLTANTAHLESAVLIEQKGQLVACFWLDGPFGVAVAGEMAPDAMMKLAQIVYDQFET